jgi:hypothetical protein
MIFNILMSILLTISYIAQTPPTISNQAVRRTNYHPFITHAGDGAELQHYVGELFEGGIVYHVSRNAKGEEHGLIVSLTDLSISSEWGLFINVPDCESSWNGQANTAAIVSAGTTGNYAAGLCDAYSGGGYTDWYLPSIQELVMLWNNLYDVNSSLSAIPGTILIAGTMYWSSTESTATSAWEFPFDGGDTGYHFNNNKSYLNHVRAVRAF